MGRILGRKTFPAPECAAMTRILPDTLPTARRRAHVPRPRAAGGSTRQLIMVTAERLFAEHGVAAVSNRQISEAAGQGNNAAVGYHFGTKADLVRAILVSHSRAMEGIRGELAERCRGSDDLRDWIVCAVRPLTDHLAGLGPASWYARFAAQVATDPLLRFVAADEAEGAASVVPHLHLVIREIDRCLEDLPAPVRQERNAMSRALILHACAEHERAGDPARWPAVATGLVDAVQGLLLAPVSAR